ncbi:helix-turn-helix domain-containing protein [Parendozoicomonas haliclonae]|uniref:HTH-type transcriptional regulator VirS n=1 Tax=Parendozoicomonas haliclonae TaxID=1960125 RepID=A0A1X7AHD3_9GAMM|nr:AraC family transcriptional regulator [Parendozoicomonas haliclonae]SMA40244.1 HTH-type transcriptional regulator VirS [Parendozoicomonas haliclonae]
MNEVKEQTRKRIRKKIAIPMVYIRHLLALMGEYGFDEQPLLMAAGIRPEELVQDDSTLDFERCDRLVTLCRQKSPEPGLGWHLGLRMNLASHGVLGTAVLASSSIGEMVNMSVQYMGTRFPLMVVSLDIKDEVAILQFDEAMDLGDNRRFYVEAYIGTHQVMRMFSYGPHASKGHDLHLALSKLDYYDDFDFGDMQVVYDQPAHQFRFPASYISKPLPMADDITREAAERKCQKQLEDMKVETGLLGKVLAFIRSREGVIPSLEQTADYLSISPRTLRRQLQEMDATYRDLINKERERLAIHYLQNSRLTVDEIAERLDYNDPSNFGRAFRKWTGHTPGYYRQQLEPEDS